VILGGESDVQRAFDSLCNDSDTVGACRADDELGGSALQIMLEVVYCLVDIDRWFADKGLADLVALELNPKTIRVTANRCDQVSRGCVLFRAPGRRPLSNPEISMKSWPTGTYRYDGIASLTCSLRVSFSFLVLVRRICGLVRALVAFSFLNFLLGLCRLPSRSLFSLGLSLLLSRGALVVIFVLPGLIFFSSARFLPFHFTSDVVHSLAFGVRWLSYLVSGGPL